MHTIIGILCFGADENEAFENAKMILRDLCRQIDYGEYVRSESGYDYYVTFDEDIAFAGKNRWGYFPVIEKVDSIKNNTLIAPWLKWLRYAEKVNDVILDMPSMKFKEDESPCINNLYDSKGREIKSFAHLKKALKNIQKDIQVYVVPADVHYNLLIIDEELYFGQRSSRKAKKKIWSMEEKIRTAFYTLDNFLNNKIFF